MPALQMELDARLEKRGGGRTSCGELIRYHKVSTWDLPDWGRAPQSNFTSCPYLSLTGDLHKG